MRPAGGGGGSGARAADRYWPAAADGGPRRCGARGRRRAARRLPPRADATRPRACAAASASGLALGGPGLDLLEERAHAGAIVGGHGRRIDRLTPTLG